MHKPFLPPKRMTNLETSPNEFKRCGKNSSQEQGAFRSFVRSIDRSMIIEVETSRAPRSSTVRLAYEPAADSLGLAFACAAHSPVKTHASVVPILK